jgi:hypothetical protein
MFLQSRNAIPYI